MELIKGDIILKDVNEDFALKVLNLKSQKEKEKSIVTTQFKKAIKSAKRHKKRKHKRLNWTKDLIEELKINVKKFGDNTTTRKLLASKFNISYPAISKAINKFIVKKELTPLLKQLWTETEKDTLIKEIDMTSPTKRNFIRIGKLLNRTEKSIHGEYMYLVKKGKVKKEKKQFINIGKDGSTKIEKEKKFNFMG